MAKPTNIYGVEVKIEVTREQIVEAIKKQFGYADARVDFDITPKRQLRGATLSIIRNEIKHDD